MISFARLDKVIKRSVSTLLISVFFCFLFVFYLFLIQFLSLIQYFLFDLSITNFPIFFSNHHLLLLLIAIFQLLVFCLPFSSYFPSRKSPFSPIDLFLIVFLLLFASKSEEENGESQFIYNFLTTSVHLGAVRSILVEVQIAHKIRLVSSLFFQSFFLFFSSALLPALSLYYFPTYLPLFLSFFPFHSRSQLKKPCRRSRSPFLCHQGRRNRERVREKPHLSLKIKE